MILVDTSIWIEFLRKRSPTFEHMLFLLEQQEIVSLEVIFGELLQGAKNPKERAVVLAYWESIKKLTTDQLWIKSGLKSGEGKWKDKGLGLVDSAILTAADESEMEIWTLDKTLLKQASKRYDPAL
ncbi:MAG: PIN domain-containing protein [Candidatus Gracilibacteria bacterium]